MKYMLLIYSDEKKWTEGERAECMAESTQICHELNAKGQFVGASPLHSVTAATSVRMRDGKKVITDGPFAETAEQLGGYYIIDVKNLDEAIAIASRLPPASKGTVEIRPIFELDNIPAPLAATTPVAAKQSS
ncbi:MAG TPA: YciI family protein [Chroococcales cyanobacterium]